MLFLGLARVQVKITTGFPSAARAAKRLGVSRKVAKDLSSLAERSLKTGEFVLPGVGRLRVPAKKVVKFHVAKAVKNEARPRKKK